MDRSTDRKGEEAKQSGISNNKHHAEAASGSCRETRSVSRIQGCVTQVKEAGLRDLTTVGHGKGPSWDDVNSGTLVLCRHDSIGLKVACEIK